jgi:hypothetical protein
MIRPLRIRYAYVRASILFRIIYKGEEELTGRQAEEAVH